MSEGGWWEQTFGPHEPEDPIRALQALLQREREKRKELEKLVAENGYRLNRVKRAFGEVYSLLILIAMFGLAALVFHELDGWKAWLGLVASASMAYYIGRGIEEKINSI